MRKMLKSVADPLCLAVFLLAGAGGCVADATTSADESDIDDMADSAPLQPENKSATSDLVSELKNTVVIFDFDQTLYDKNFRDNKWAPYAKAAIEALKGKVPFAVCSKNPNTKGSVNKTLNGIGVRNSQIKTGENNDKSDCVKRFAGNKHAIFYDDNSDNIKDVKDGVTGVVAIKVDPGEGLTRHHFRDGLQKRLDNQ